MPEFISVEQAKSMSGLRVVLVPGIPSPWGEALKGILHLKKIPYVWVRQEPGGPNLALKEWTAQTSAPVAILNDERARSTWLEQLYLAERLAPDPSLIPASIDERIAMIGWCNEICGENGLGWSRRLMMIHAGATNPAADEAARRSSLEFGRKYGYQPAAAQAAPLRVAEIVRALSARLESQRAHGSRLLMGDRLSALDIYWATFAALLKPLPDEHCPMTRGFRRMYTNTDPAIDAAASTALFEHRDFIYREYLGLPLQL